MVAESVVSMLTAATESDWAAFKVSCFHADMNSSKKRIDLQAACPMSLHACFATGLLDYQRCCWSTVEGVLPCASRVQNREAGAGA
jgi:hypothetical protein